MVWVGVKRRRVCAEWVRGCAPMWCADAELRNWGRMVTEQASDAERRSSVDAELRSGGTEEPRKGAEAQWRNSGNAEMRRSGNTVLRRGGMAGMRKSADAHMAAGRWSAHTSGGCPVPPAFLRSDAAV